MNCVYADNNHCGDAVAIMARNSPQHKQRFALLLGSAVNQDGRSSGLTAPNGPSQTSLITDVVSAAGIAAGSLSFVAVHGTGTSLGDPIEVSALGSALAPRKGAHERPAAMGSVKACYGHTEGAAGVTGAHCRSQPLHTYLALCYPLAGLLPFMSRTPLHSSLTPV